MVIDIQLESVGCGEDCRSSMFFDAFVFVDGFGIRLDFLAIADVCVEADGSAEKDIDYMIMMDLILINCWKKVYFL